MNIKFTVLEKDSSLIFVEKNGDAYSLKNNVCEFIASYTEIDKITSYKRIIQDLLSEGYKHIKEYRKIDFYLFKNERRTHLRERKILRDFIEYSSYE